MASTILKMLLIDDRTLTTDLDRAGYRSMGVSVKIAANFQAAAELLTSKQFDIIVINYDYEYVNAPDVCRHFKTDPEYREIPVVITSVQSNAETRKKSIEAGANLFVEQPLPRQYFIEKLKKLLEQSTRDNNRVEYTGKAEVVNGDETLLLTIADLSATGLLLATDRKFEQGQSMRVSFSVPGYKKPVVVHGEVVRIIAQTTVNSERLPGVGVRFVEFVGDSKKRLEKYVETTASKDVKLAYYL